jgi:hypothetical protein
MEVDSHETRADIWEDAFQYGFKILHEWFGPDLLDKADRIAGEMNGGTAPGESQWRERLEVKHLTEAQRQYSGRCYPKIPAGAGRPLPWPAPEPVERETIERFASIVQEEPPTSPKAQAALRLLSVAAVIEAARRSDAAGISECE